MDIAAGRSGIFNRHYRKPGAFWAAYEFEGDRNNPFFWETLTYVDRTLLNDVLMRWLQRPDAAGPSEGAVAPWHPVPFIPENAPFCCLTRTPTPLSPFGSSRLCTRPDTCIRPLSTPGINQPTLGCGFIPGVSMYCSTSKTPSTCYN